MAKSAKDAVKRKGKGAPAYVDDTPSNADAPRRWNDYTVHFEFPDPSDVGNSLIQLIDVDFKYPGRDDFGLQVRVGLPSHVPLMPNIRHFLKCAACVMVLTERIIRRRRRAASSQGLTSPRQRSTCMHEQKLLGSCRSLHR